MAPSRESPVAPQRPTESQSQYAALPVYQTYRQGLLGDAILDYNAIVTNALLPVTKRRSVTQKTNFAPAHSNAYSPQGYCFLSSKAQAAMMGDISTSKLPYQQWAAKPGQKQLDETERALRLEEEELDHRLTQWRLKFEEEHGRAPKLSDIQADDLVFMDFERRKHISRQIALRTLLPDGCAFYIERRRRLCVAKALPGQAVCIRHTQEALAAARRLAESGHAGDEQRGQDDLSESCRSRKTNMSRRMKRMCNPHSYMVPAHSPDWSVVFDNPGLPSFLDIGCAKGRYVERLRHQDPAVFGEHYNYIGMEIWEPLVLAANERARALGGARNLHYVAGNVKISLEGLGVPNLRRVSILFPDPWDSTKHRDRRLMDQSFAAMLARVLPVGGEIYVASDWLEIAKEIRDTLLGSGAFVAIGNQGQVINMDLTGEDFDWLSAPSFGNVLSERDEVCNQHWRPVYRTLLQRTAA